MGAYLVHLDQFEGPLSLLLYLIRKEEMDIYDIPVYQITESYLQELKRMKELDLEVAGEFIAMAATLIHIKSRMLLPTYNEDGEEIEAEDPRKELVQKLLAYEKYKNASQDLYERPLLGRDQWVRGIREKIDEPEGEIILEDRGLFALISCYRKVVRNLQKRVHKVAAKGQSVSARIFELKNLLVTGRRMTIDELFSSNQESKEKLLITFLSLLELTRMRFINVYQSTPDSPLYLEPIREIESNIMSQVQEFEAEDVDRVADLIFDNIDMNTEDEDELSRNESESEPQLSLVPQIDESLEHEEIATDEDIEAEEKALGLVDESDNESSLQTDIISFQDVRDELEGLNLDISEPQSLHTNEMQSEDELVQNDEVLKLSDDLNEDDEDDEDDEFKVEDINVFLSKRERDPEDQV